MAETNDERLRTYYQSGDIWEQEVVKKAKRSRALAWLITTIFGAITLVSLATLAMLVPLKSFEPYIVEVDKNTGYVEVKTGLTRPTNLTEQQAITQANIVRYIRSREGYDPFSIEQNFGIAALLSTGNAARQLQCCQSTEPRKSIRAKQACNDRDRVGHLSQHEHRDRPFHDCRAIRDRVHSAALDRCRALSLY
jgi:type IV secretory pathway component VirB8